jgi:hypothetical protein
LYDILIYWYKNVRENRRGYQEWTIQRQMQQWAEEKKNSDRHINILSDIE